MIAYIRGAEMAVRVAISVMSIRLTKIWPADRFSLTREAISICDLLQFYDSFVLQPLMSSVRSTSIKSRKRSGMLLFWFLVMFLIEKLFVRIVAIIANTYSWSGKVGKIFCQENHEKLVNYFFQENSVNEFTNLFEYSEK